MNQHGGDRAVDPARKPADHTSITHLLADFRDLGFAIGGHGPIARKPAHLVHEIRQQPGAIGRVDHFGVELRAVILPRFVRDNRERRAVADCDDFKAGCKLGHLVAMAHPHLVAFAFVP